MPHIALSCETDFEGWRAAARALALEAVEPDDVNWSVANSSEPELFASSQLPVNADHAAFTVPAAFMELARSVVLHRHPERFALLYRLLWRMRTNTGLLHVGTDRDVVRIRSLARDVHRDQHKMEAFVRFREFGNGPHSRFVAWFEPDHHIVEATSPFFAQRFADMAWSILTPDCCAHWEGSEVFFTPGAAKSDAPSSDPLEDIWRSYYASIFNPARLKIKAMKAEMPVKYWRNLPEASMIGSLIEQAGHRAQTMIERAPAETRASRQQREQSMAPARSTSTETLQHLRDEAAGCRACDLWKDATQTVFGEGPRHAPVMMVGEQPGDKEDLAGKPFVGPAGQILDRALKEAGIDRTNVYVTNAVKHFKFVPRGKVRLHQKPNAPEIKACRPWYERERAAIKPLLVVAMGATAAQSVFGKTTPINKSRGRLNDLDGDAKVLVTVHPSYLLRLPDADARTREYEKFVADLRMAADFLRHTPRSSHAAA
jgi:uracil-DNA glycosylase